MSTRTLSLILGVVLASSAVAQTQRVERLVGKPIPAFSMTETKTSKAVTNASLKGKVVLLDFWATWCGPCLLASPTMQKLHEKYAGKGLVVVGANISDTPAAVKGYAAKHNYGYRFTHGNDSYSDKIGIQGIPAFIFIDRKGVVRRVATGFSPSSSPASFEKTVQDLLAKK